MCTTCGCNGAVSHQHGHHPHASHDHEDQARILQVEQNILSKNDQYAATNRQMLSDHKVAAFNLVSSPGSGKTTLLVKTIQRLKDAARIAVIEGDQQTELDAQRIRETGVSAQQINTGKGCHLDAHQVGHALEHWSLDELDIIYIENVGNLVCPAAFDLGEAARVVVLSVTEGEDKPLKYPDMFYASDLMLINKIDLLPYLDFDVEKSIEYARRINPDIQVLQVSAKTGQGMDAWIQWCRQTKVSPARATVIPGEFVCNTAS